MSDSPARKPASLLTFVDAPPFGSGSMPAEQEKAMVMLAHFCAIIIWPWKRRESPAVDAHGREALNFAITILLIYVIPLQILLRTLPASLWFIVSLVTLIGGLSILALVIVAVVKAAEGKLLRYPVNFRFLR